MKLQTKIIRTYLSSKGNKTQKEIAKECGTSSQVVANALTDYFKKKHRFHNN